MKAREFIAKLIDIAKNYRTAYMWGGIGGPITNSYINGRAQLYASIYSASYVQWLRSLVGKDYFGMDCIGVIKAVLWGWNGNRNHVYGGANYTSNGVPDISSEGMRLQLKVRTTDFSKIKPGHAVWLPGHIGVYVGDGLVVEATPAWRNGVQLTALANLGSKSGYPARAWREHGEIPYVDYSIQSSGGGAGMRKYTVKATDTDGYWGIAARELGSGFRFEEILSLNNRQATDHIRAGEVLLLPIMGAPGLPEKLLPYGDLTLELGAEGVLVKALQIALIHQGKADIDVDGSFGNLTKAAVIKFQKDNDLTADGVAGVDVWKIVLGAEER